MARKSTPLSDQILSVLQAGHLMTAPQILETLSKAGNEYNKTSLYRALDKLIDDDKLCKHSLGRSQIYYELRTHHHDHLVCIKCHKLDSVNCALSDLDMIKGYRVQHHHLTIFGTCPDCQQKEKSS